MLCDAFVSIGFVVMFMAAFLNMDFLIFAAIISSVGTLVTLLESFPMYWVIFVTYSEGSILLKMMKKIADRQSKLRQSIRLRRNTKSLEELRSCNSSEPNTEMKTVS